VPDCSVKANAYGQELDFKCVVSQKDICIFDLERLMWMQAWPLS
jgi:hypothetical protein